MVSEDASDQGKEFRRKDRARAYLGSSESSSHRGSTVDLRQGIRTAWWCFQGGKGEGEGIGGLGPFIEANGEALDGWNQRDNGGAKSPRGGLRRKFRMGEEDDDMALIGGACTSARGRERTGTVSGFGLLGRRPKLRARPNRFPGPVSIFFLLSSFSLSFLFSVFYFFHNL
jgi:hypothetical protein